MLLNRRRDALAAGFTQYIGRVCLKHPDKLGRRNTSTAHCVGCKSERVAARRKAKKAVKE